MKPEAAHVILIEYDFGLRLYGIRVYSLSVTTCLQTASLSSIISAVLTTLRKAGQPNVRNVSFIKYILTLISHHN